MPFTYTIQCTEENCGNLAQFKVASRWSDGITEELKTYALVCSTCLSVGFWRSMARYKACRLSPGEELDEPGIYHFEEPGKTGTLCRAKEIESNLRNSDRS